jgi:hypothetical protein
MPPNPIIDSISLFLNSRFCIPHQRPDLGPVPPLLFAYAPFYHKKKEKYIRTLFLWLTARNFFITPLQGIASISDFRIGK